MDEAVDGFISYAHDDVAVCREVLKHLRPTERKFGLKFWHDSHIAAGHHWNDEIKEAIRRADVFVLLVSPEFLGSDFIYDTEIPEIKRRLEICKGKAISVLVRDCDWEFAVGATQAVPAFEGRTRPIEDWKPRSKGYDAARRQIESAIARHFGMTITSEPWPRT